MKKQGCEVEAIGINKQKKLIRNRPERIFRYCEEADQEPEEEARVEQISSFRRFRHILKDVNFLAKPSEIHAIVGPSGAGKSSLLEIIATKVSPQSGSILVNQKPVDKAMFRKISGYVTKKDTLFPLLTVEEILMFSAMLRLNLPQQEVCSRVKSLIQELGLSHVARSSRVGDERTPESLVVRSEEFPLVLKSCMILKC